MQIPFKINYNLTLKDVQLFSINRLRKQIRFWPLFLIVPILNIIGNIILDGRVLTTSNYVSLFIPIVFFALYQSILHNIQKQYSSQEQQLQGITLIFTETGIKTESTGQESFLDYSNYTDIQKDKDFLTLIRVDKMTHFIPIRYFKDEDEIYELGTFFRTKTNT
jgi:hypothetical protein